MCTHCNINNIVGVVHDKLTLFEVILVSGIASSFLALQEKWSALYDVRTILLSLQSLLGEPNNDSPLNAEAAELWENQAGG